MRKLYRSSTNSIIGGVCGGLGEHFNIDPTIVRIVAVIALLSGVGLLPYIIMWFITPMDI
jgi:phage shock protein PspC (stress-responsive transcriptional regulator)